jgi:hypothetical protein
VLGLGSCCARCEACLLSVRCVQAAAQAVSGRLRCVQGLLQVRALLLQDCAS